MLDKPDGCLPCPLYGDGRGFVPGHFPEGAELMVLGQNPGAEEENEGIPLIGATGRTLENDYLPLAGSDPREIAKDNVLRCRWRKPGTHKNTNELPTGRILDQAIQCCAQYDYIPDTVELVVVMGVLALRKVSPKLTQHEWRGFLIPEGD